MSADPWAFGWTQLLTIIGFAITISIAIGGFRTFGRWKREKIEEKRIEAAINALAIGYEAKFVFEAIRSRYHRSEEYGDGYIQEWGEGPRVALKEGQRGPYVVLKRLTRHDEYFDRVRKIEPLVMAIFGKDMATIFSKLYEARTRVQSAAEILMQLEGLEIDDKKARQENIELRKTIFASGGKAEEGDEVGRLIESFTANIARICGPLVDEEFGKNRAASYVVVTQK